MRAVRWYPDSLPDYLWLSLIFLPATRIEAFAKLRTSFLTLDQAAPQHGLIPNFQELSRLSDKNFDSIIRPFFESVAMTKHLSALALLPSFPGRKKWMKHLQELDEREALQILGEAVGRSIAQQGTMATDIAFAMECYALRTGKFVISSDLAEESIRRINSYAESPDPNAGSMFRATRNMLNGSRQHAQNKPFSAWSDRFWRWGRKQTRCFPGDDSPAEPSQEELLAVQRSFLSSFEANEDAVQNYLMDEEGGVERDHRREVVAGLFFYASQVLLGAIAHSPASAPLQISATRIIADVCLSLSYMAHTKDADIFRRFQEYGYGKAKLFYMKNAEKRFLPASLRSMKYESLVDEFAFAEFVNVDFGTFFKKKTREMAADVGLSEYHENFYEWPTTFVHAEWAPARAKCLTVCANPLHRFHYIPHMGPDNFRATMELMFGAMNPLLDCLRDSYGVKGLEHIALPAGTADQSPNADQEGGQPQ